MLMIVLLIGAVLCDVAGQLCFKIGVDEKHAAPGLLATLTSRWIVAGVLVYAVEFTCWFAALSMTPLSFAFPFMALSYCGVVVASRFILHERVSRRRWLATVTIAFGVALVCAP
jgi:undecaprenyl phosphate-alpha-L-ara4N flippase subunit ArnE